MPCRKRFRSKKAKFKYEAYKHIRLVRVRSYLRKGGIRVRRYWRRK